MGWLSMPFVLWSRSREPAKALPLLGHGFLGIGQALEQELKDKVHTGCYSGNREPKDQCPLIPG